LTILGFYPEKKKNLMLIDLIRYLGLCSCHLYCSHGYLPYLINYDTFNGLGLAIVALGIPVYYFAMPKKCIPKGYSASF
jgi:hypothetical protein